MSTPSTVEGHSMEREEEMEIEDHFDSSSSHVHDSSKEGEGDESTAKPKRHRKITQRYVETFPDEQPQSLHKVKKKIPAPRMDEHGQTHEESEEHNEPSGSHEMIMDESEKKTRVVPGKMHVQCNFMESKKKSNSQCKQRAIEGYGFCIWHILNDPLAPYRRCGHMRQVVKKDGVERRVQCKTAIKSSLDPPLCLAHSDRNKRKRKRESHQPSPSSPSKAGSPLVSLNKSSPSSPSSSIFNLRNEEFALDIDEAIDNMANMDDLIDAFDDFDSIDNLEEEERREEGEKKVKKEEKKEEEEEEKKVKKELHETEHLQFEYDDELTAHEKELMDDLIVPLFNIGQKLIDRLAHMRKNCMNKVGFWAASRLYPEVPCTIQHYFEQQIHDLGFEKMNVPLRRREELRSLMTDPEVHKEVNSLHEYNMGLLREMCSLQRSLLNSAGRE